MTETQQLRDALDEAGRGFYRAQSALSRAISDARTALEAEHRPAILAARDAVSDAQAALDAHLEASVTHPWDGKRVYKMSNKYDIWVRNPKPQRTDGIVEVVRSTSKFPANMKYSKPRIGDVIVRAVKKDGSPSLQVASSGVLHDIQKVWTLVEGQD